MAGLITGDPPPELYRSRDRECECEGEERV